MPSLLRTSQSSHFAVWAATSAKRTVRICRVRVFAGRVDCGVGMVGGPVVGELGVAGLPLPPVLGAVACLVGVSGA